MIETVHHHHLHEADPHAPEQSPRKAGVINRWKEKRKQRKEERFVERIFDRAMQLAQKEELPDHMRQESPAISSEIQDTIIDTAKRMGKENEILDTKDLSDNQLDIFTRSFDYLYKHRPTVSSRLFGRIVVGGNVGVGVAEGITEAITGGSSAAVWMDPPHNLIDGYIYNEQLNNVQEPNSTKAKSYRRRKAMYTLYSSMSAALGVKATVDLGLDLTSDYDATPGSYALYTTSASVLLNGGLALARYRQIRKHRKNTNGLTTHHDHDVNKHLAVDSASAGLAFTGAIAGASLLGPAAGIASAVLGVKYFLPTAENLRESYHTHGGEALQENHHHEEHETTIHTKQKKRSRLKKIVAGVSTAAALAGTAIFGAKTISTSQEPQWISPDAATVAPLVPSIPEKTTPPEKIRQAPITDTEQITKGEWLWKMVEDKVEKERGEPSIPITDVIVDFATFDNSLSKKDHIKPGQYQLINYEAIDVIADAYANPPGPNASADDKTFVADLKEWNKGEPSIEDPTEQERFKRISQYLQLEINNK